jgi:hypothetical protein
MPLTFPKVSPATRRTVLMLNNICMEVLKDQISKEKRRNAWRDWKTTISGGPHAFGCLVYFSSTGMMLGAPKRVLWCSRLTRDLAMFQRHGISIPIVSCTSLSCFSTVHRGVVPDAKAVWVFFINLKKKGHSSENCCKIGLALRRRINRFQ